MQARSVPDSPSDSSVTFSLSELVELEKQRLREERERDADRERARADRARADAERARALADQDRARADEERRAASHRDAEEAARVEGRKQAEIEVARIESEARIRLESDEAARRHELLLLRERLDRRAVRGRGALAALLGIAVVGGAAAHLSSRGDRARLEAELGAARADVVGATSERDAARADVESHRRQVDAAERRAEEAGAGRLPALDHRRDDLAGWAADRRRSDLLDDVAVAAAEAHRAPSDQTIAAYGLALDGVRKGLGAPARRVGAGPVPDPGGKVPEGNACSNPKDPLCGFNGKSL